MLTLITSCGRGELLLKTIESLHMSTMEQLKVTVHEDAKDASLILWPGLKTITTKGIGQHASIDKFLKQHQNSGNKYYLHCEDDWEFNKDHQNWIADSIEIMESDPSIIKVLAYGENIHAYKTENDIQYLMPTEFYGNMWYGWSWNPGVTRFDLLSKYDILNMSEHEKSIKIHNDGLKVAYLPYPLYTHIGGEQSTRTNHLNNEHSK